MAIGKDKDLLYRLSILINDPTTDPVQIFAFLDAVDPERIVDEMHHLEADFGVRDVAFVDSCFTPNRKRIAP